jgi:hypothetical protein
MTDKSLLIENATIIFRNFAGKEGQYNRAGDRNFCLLLDFDLAEQMLQDGWNVKALKQREPDDPPQPYLPVSVSFKGRPPKISLITFNGCRHSSQEECLRRHRRNPLEEEMVEIVDMVDIASVDLIINPYEWAVSGKSGVKAYLKTMFVTLHEDALEIKYSEIQTRDARLEIEGADWVEGEVLEERLAIEG